MGLFWRLGHENRIRVNPITNMFGNLKKHPKPNMFGNLKSKSFDVWFSSNPPQTDKTFSNVSFWHIVVSVLCVQSLGTAPAVACWRQLAPWEQGGVILHSIKIQWMSPIMEKVYPVNNQANHFHGERRDNFQPGLAWRNHWLQMRSHPQPCESTRAGINFFMFVFDCVNSCFFQRLLWTGNEFCV